MAFRGSRSDRNRIHEILVQLQRNRNKKQFIELGLKSLVRIWVTFPLPAILISYNNAISLVQGPPGTGKTYLGVEIVKALLHNKKALGLKPIICV